MGSEPRDDAEYGRLVAEFPLAPIVDDGSYRAAIAVLDRLFARDGRRTPAERAYFHALARNAHRYEQAGMTA